jgi:cystathionine gamma-synthase
MLGFGCRQTCQVVARRLAVVRRREEALVCRWASSTAATTSSTHRNDHVVKSSTITITTEKRLPVERIHQYFPEQELHDKSKPLGSPIPFDEHACSVSLPTWSSVVGYEEGDTSITSALKCGYPRFVYHPYILQLMQVVLDKFSSNSTSTARPEDCLVLPTKQAALRCQAFLQQALEKNSVTIDNALVEIPQGKSSSTPSSHTIQNDGVVSRIRTVSIDHANVHAVLFPAETIAGMEAKAYWQHCGELVSSRRAEQALRKLGEKIKKRVTCCPETGTPAIHHSSDDEAAETPTSTSTTCSPFIQLQDRITEWTNVPSDHVFLTPSGMSTMYKALRSSRRYQMEKDPSSRGGTSIVFGFPYLDTLKLCSRREFCPDGVEFFGKADEKDLKLLERLLQQRVSSRWSALITEVPSNPLLQCPDLEKLRELADKHDFCLIVDDTIGNFLNVDLIDSGLADAVCTSLTKLVSGRGDVMAGSVVVNPNTEKGRWMQQDMAKEVDTYGGLHEADARALLHNSANFPERNAKINDTSERLADFLNSHPDVETVWYPKLCAPLYPKVQKGGYGGLMSIHLHPHMCQRAFYDGLDVAKGPSLGTNFTLICPYTLLAHYHELDFALSCNVPPNLIRIAVGLEDFDVLKARFEAALARSRLHLKLPMTKKSS